MSSDIPRPDPPNPDALADRLKQRAEAIGFDFVGIAPAVAPPGYGHFLDWLAEGCDAGMGYLRKHEQARSHPESVLPGVRSIVMAGFVYGHPDPIDRPPSSSSSRTGKIARYARGDDYHRLLWDRLGALLDWLREQVPGMSGRAVSDTAPLLERDYARLAGLGWIGKNTMLIDTRLGSYTLLGALLTDLDLRPDAPHAFDHCGTCTRCLDACPTDAFSGPYRLDARRCISYWTIEHRGMIPDEQAEQLHGWAFGCDICQEVCPWNRKAPSAREPRLMPDPDRIEPDLVSWLEADARSFSKTLKGSAMSRAKRSGLLRNAAYLLGHRRETSAVPALIDRLLSDDDPIIRASSAWALGRIGCPDAIQALRNASDQCEADSQVREAIASALHRAITGAEMADG